MLPSLDPVLPSASDTEAWRAAARAAAAFSRALTSVSDSVAAGRSLKIERPGVREDLRSDAGCCCATSRAVTVFRPREEPLARPRVPLRDDSAPEPLSSSSLTADDAAREARVLRDFLPLLVAGVLDAILDAAAREGARDDAREGVRPTSSFSDPVSKSVPRRDGGNKSSSELEPDDLAWRLSTAGVRGARREASGLTPSSEFAGLAFGPFLPRLGLDTGASLSESATICVLETPGVCFDLLGRVGYESMPEASAASTGEGIRDLAVFFGRPGPLRDLEGGVASVAVVASLSVSL